MFNYVNNIDKKDKRLFTEKVKLFIRLIKAHAKSYNLSFSSVNSTISSSTINKLIELNIVESGLEGDIKLLKNTLKKDIFNDFIKAINYSIQHNKLIGSLLNNLDPIKRRALQKELSKINKPKIVDLFCGAGGLSLGFTQEGFRVVFANDFEDVCVETFRYNHPEVPDERVVLGDIRDLVDTLQDQIDTDIDVLVGGPPCQGFSSANQQRIIDDPRNELYKFYLKAVSQLTPKFVVMENVKGMLPFAEQIVEDFNNVIIKRKDSSYSYSVDCKVLKSNEFGVAQNRHRLIFIAVRSDVSEQKAINPTEIFQEIENNNTKLREHALKSALDYIKPLKAPRIKNTTDIDDDVTGKVVDMNMYQGNENSYLKLINEDRIIEYVFNHKARYTNDINYEIYRTLDQGDDGTSEKIQHVMPYKHRNHIFKDKYFKLIENQPSRTITAHLKMDCHSHIHPRQIRSITPREAARIQSFPDDYVFLGAYLKTYMQIGNAVPPLMARGIAKVLKKYID